MPIRAAYSQSAIEQNVTRPCQLGFDKNLSNQVCVSLDLLLNRSLCRYSDPCGGGLGNITRLAAEESKFLYGTDFI